MGLRSVDERPLCGGAKNCTNYGWISCCNQWLCSDCYAKWMRHNDRLKKEAMRQAMKDAFKE